MAGTRTIRIKKLKKGATTWVHPVTSRPYAIGDLIPVTDRHVQKLVDDGLTEDVALAPAPKPERAARPVGDEDEDA